jgi:hypothetical protein
MGQERKNQMTDIQLLTLAIAVIVPLSLLIYSNSRISDAKETLRAKKRSQHQEMINRFDRLENMLKMHELEHHR